MIDNVQKYLDSGEAVRVRIRSHWLNYVCLLFVPLFPLFLAGSKNFLSWIDVFLSLLLLALAAGAVIYRRQVVLTDRRLLVFRGLSGKAVEFSAGETAVFWSANPLDKLFGCYCLQITGQKRKIRLPSMAVPAAAAEFLKQNLWSKK